MRRYLLLGLLGLCAASSGANCLWWQNIQQSRQAALLKFGSDNELRNYLAEQAKTRLFSENLFRDDFSYDFMPMPATSEAAQTGAETDGGGSGYSTTTIQEAGVDESDIVKNNGQYIYALENNIIHIVQATPPESVTELATIEIPDWGDSLYLRNNTLIALSIQYVYSSWWDMPGDDQEGADTLGGQWNDGPQTTVTLIDVSDPANPRVTTTLDFEGNLVSSRMIDNYLHVIMTTVPFIPYEATEQTIDDMKLDEWLPDYRLTVNGEVLRSGDIAGWQNFYRPAAADGYGITTVVTIDVDNPTGEFAKTSISADAGVIYASTQSLYISDTQYDWESGSGREDTIIHKLGFTEAATDYAASGIVPGRPLNQYSLGEHENYLRIATTQEDWTFMGGLAQTNGVYVLGQNGTALEVVGQIDNIAPGESIYAARFLGPRGFLVTFQKIDPLFTMDLSVPTQPRMIGELKVPGYSDYIQLMDENHLLTIGKDAVPDETGDFSWYQGVQLSIFDITDMANPTPLHQKIIGARGTNSEANYNPKAFNYYAPLNALAFPLDLYEGQTTGPQYGTYTYSGLYVYRVTVENGFEELGRISSTDDATLNECWIYGGFTRGVFIGNHVYSVTDRAVKAAALEDVNTVVGQAPYENAEPLENNCWWWEDTFLATLPVGGGIQ